MKKRRSSTGRRTRVLSITLKDCQIRKGEEPLEDVFNAALRIITCRREGEPEMHGMAQWLARRALRGVCEAVIIQGFMPVPLEVDMRFGPERGKDEV